MQLTIDEICQKYQADPWPKVDPRSLPSVLLRAGVKALRELAQWGVRPYWADSGLTYRGSGPDGDLTYCGRDAPPPDTDWILAICPAGALEVVTDDYWNSVLSDLAMDNRMVIPAALREIYCVDPERDPSHLRAWRGNIRNLPWFQVEIPWSHENPEGYLVALETLATELEKHSL